MSNTAIRIGILGTARIARTMAPAIAATPGVELTAIASRDPDKAVAFAAEFGIDRVHQDYRQLIDDPEIDAVYIPLPPSMHCEWTIHAARAGKHVLCEKPLALNTAEVEQMTAVCLQQNVVLLDGVMWYHTQRAQAMKEIVHRGDLGDVCQLTSAFTFPGDKLDPANLRLHRATGGGSLLDLGWYCVGASLWLTDRVPLKVWASARWKNDVDLHLNGVMWFDDDIVGTVECGFTAVRRRWIEVAGTQAVLRCDDFTRPWNRQQSSIRIIDSEGQSQQQLFPEPPQEESMVTEFCRLIHSNDCNHPWLKLSRDTQQVCEALDTSARSGNVVSLV